MSITRSVAEEKLSTQRAAIREHIEKYERYYDEWDKSFALKTIRNCQERIRTIKRQCSMSTSDSWEDDWTA